MVAGNPAYSPLFMAPGGLPEYGLLQSPPRPLPLLLIPPLACTDLFSASLSWPWPHLPSLLQVLVHIISDEKVRAPSDSVRNCSSSRSEDRYGKIGLFTPANSSYFCRGTRNRLESGAWRPTGDGGEKTTRRRHGF